MDQGETQTQVFSDSDSSYENTDLRINYETNRYTYVQTLRRPWPDDLLLFWGFPAKPEHALPLIVPTKLPKYFSIKESVRIDWGLRREVSEIFRRQQEIIYVEDSVVPISDDCPSTEVDTDSEAETCILPLR